MTAILGISAYYHDSAAALVVDGEIVAAAQEERFTRKKHDDAFPLEAVAFCLRRAGLTLEDLDFVAFYEKPLRKFERLLETYVATAPRGFSSFRKAIPLWVATKLHLPREMKRELLGLRERGLSNGRGYRRPFVFLEHHESHAASAFFPSPFERSAVLTIDGVGEWACASWGVGNGRELRLEEEQAFPHSLGLLYSAVTYFCGFRVNSGEYKLMGLAPYGAPRYLDQLRTFVDIDARGAIHLDQDFFDYCHGLRMTSPRFDQFFGGAPRLPETPITQREVDLAASVQRLTEEIVLRMARYVHERTGEANLCLAGGVALNCVANGRIRREGPFEDIWIQPAAGDAGGALGAALQTWHGLLEKPRELAARGGAPDQMRGALLGPAFEQGEIERRLRSVGAHFDVEADDAALAEHVAKRIARGAVVGWFQGPMEFGPRALGSRSILADPRSAETQSSVNVKIKYRESFRPFAPCVLAERASEVFDMVDGAPSPYMLEVTGVRSARPMSAEDVSAALFDEREAAAERVGPDSVAQAPTMQEREGAGGEEAGLSKILGRSSDQYPAITHLDGSARVQTVDERHPDLRRLLEAFERQTGCPVLVNTSFNVRGEPIVEAPETAFRCFLATEMDVLVVGRCVMEKTEQDQQLSAAERARHVAQFDLD